MHVRNTPHSQSIFRLGVKEAWSFDPPRLPKIRLVYNAASDNIAPSSTPGTQSDEIELFRDQKAARRWYAETYLQVAPAAK
jgi:hypothetical protein